MGGGRSFLGGGGCLVFFFIIDKNTQSIHKFQAQ